MTKAPTRPILRYHGGKWLLAPWILSYFPEHRVYTEPYSGAWSVGMRKGRAYGEVYNDLSGEIVNLFRVARDSGLDLQERLRLTPFSREEFVLSYEPCADPVEQARRTVVRSFMGFGSNGLNAKTGFRANSNRSGTTPAQDWRNYPDCLAAIIDRLQGVVIENRPAIEVILQHDSSETLHYVDPPYVFSTRDSGTDYAHEMTDDQHERLAEVLHEVQGMVVLSGYRCDLYDQLYSDWECVQRKAYADGARDRVECLWLNPITSALQAQLKMF